MSIANPVVYGLFTGGHCISSLSVASLTLLTNKPHKVIPGSKAHYPSS